MNVTEDATVALVIGGVGDGVRHAVQGNNLVMSSLKRDIPFGPVEAAAGMPVEFHRDYYRLEWFRSGQRRFAMYVINHMSHEEAVERLFAGYRENGK
jgi:hypothetical protein